MCYTGHWTLGGREDISITHLIIIIKSEVSTFPIVVIFSVAVCLMWLYHHMPSVSYISRESWVFCLSLLCSLMMCAKDEVHYDPMVVFDCLHVTLRHYRHHAELSENIELLKCLSGTFCFEYVSKIKSILSIIFPVIYGAMCIQLTHLSYYDYENTCTLYYCHHQIGSMTHLPLFGVRSWNNGARCISFYILTITLCHGSSTTRTNESYHHMYQSISQLSWSRPRVAPMYHYKQLSFP